MRRIGGKNYFLKSHFVTFEHRRRNMRTKDLLVSFLALTLYLGCHAQDEPSLKLKVTVDGEPTYVNEGDTLRIGDKSVIIETSGAKTFQLSSLEFEYPRDFGFHHQTENTVRSWTLDGNEFVIMVFELPRAVELESFTREIVKKFGRKNCKVSNRKVQLTNLELKGKRIDVTVLGSHLTYDLFPLDLSDGKTHIITFQDTKSDAGGDSREGVATMKLISDSMKIQE
jgi:hypothetical protein